MVKISNCRVSNNYTSIFGIGIYIIGANNIVVEHNEIKQNGGGLRIGEAGENITIVGYYNRADAWLKKDDYNKAIADYNKAIEIDPNYAAAYNNRAIIWRKKGEYNKAIADHNKAVELNPNYAEAYHNRGFAYLELGNHEEAVTDFNQCLKIMGNKSVLAEKLRGIILRLGYNPEF